MPVNDWIAAGRAGAQGLSDAHGVIRDNSPKYGETFRTNMNARANERVAQLRAREKILSAKTQANIVGEKSKRAAKAIDKATDRKVKGFRKAGVLGALGGIAGGALTGYMTKQEEKRLDERDAKREAADLARLERIRDLYKPASSGTPTAPPQLIPIPPIPEFNGGELSPSPSTSGDGGTVSLKGIRNDVYSYLTTHHKLSRNHALGMMANIDRESGFDPYILSGDDDGPGGLFQWKGSRQTPEVAALVKAGDWKGQLDRALSEPEHISAVAPGLYASTDFKTPHTAADWLMQHYLRPADTVSGSKKNAEFLSTYTSF